MCDEAERTGFVGVKELEKRKKLWAERVTSKFRFSEEQFHVIKCPKCASANGAGKVEWK